jgi:polyketide cyclase/dehydrase/lipid transport protein
VFSAEATVVIRRPARDVLEFVLDLERYRQADTKIGRVDFVERNGNAGRARYAGTMRGLPGPTETVTWTLEPYSRLRFASTPSLWPGLVYRFEGLFTCEEGPEGTRVLHRETVVLRPPISWFVDPLLRGWLARDIVEEMQRMKRLLEGANSPRTDA